MVGFARVRLHQAARCRRRCLTSRHARCGLDWKGFCNRLQVKQHTRGLRGVHHGVPLPRLRSSVGARNLDRAAATLGRRTSGRGRGRGLIPSQLVNWRR
jgi:hypothetical protein